MELPFNIDLRDKVAVVTGGSGVLGSVLCRALAKSGAKVVVIARKKDAIDKVVQQISEEGGKAIGLSVDVMNREELEDAREEVISTFGTCDILINGAGGNHPKATTSHEKLTMEDLHHSGEQTFFDLDENSVDWLFKLNFMGTLLPTQIFAKDMAGKGDAVIINISSMNGFTPLTKIPAYSGAKAAISNFTQWLAVYFSEVGIRVNAIAPGFFLTSQNESLLKKENGEFTERAQKILTNTPQGRFGEPEELIGTLLWLTDYQSSKFVNGIVVPVDGGFSAYSGV